MRHPLSLLALVLAALPAFAATPAPTPGTAPRYLQGSECLDPNLVRGFHTLEHNQLIVDGLGAMVSGSSAFIGALLFALALFVVAMLTTSQSSAINAIVRSETSTPLIVPLSKCHATIVSHVL